jgi:hypothetical protein
MISSDERYSFAKLVRGCLKRPADEAAWREFVGSFHLIIQTSVLKAVESLTYADAGRDPNGDLADRLVRAVYIRLIEDRSEALRPLKSMQADSIYRYLTLVSIRVARDHITKQFRPEILRDTKIATSSPLTGVTI